MGPVPVPGPAELIATTCSSTPSVGPKLVQEMDCDVLILFVKKVTIE